MIFDRSHVNMLRLVGEYTSAHEYCLERITDPDALAEIAFDYHHGLAVAQDHEKGAYYDLLAAEGGSAQGLYQLGNSYFHGYAVVPNGKDRFVYSVELIKKAADLGWVDAKLHLGEMYLHGDLSFLTTGRHSFCIAEKLFTECSETGDLRGTVLLALCKAAGYRVRRLRNHVRMGPTVIFRSTDRSLSDVIRYRRPFDHTAPRGSEHHNARWRRKRNSFPSTSLVERLCVLETDNQEERRAIIALHKHLLKVIETSMPKGCC